MVSVNVAPFVVRAPTGSRDGGRFHLCALENGALVYNPRSLKVDGVIPNLEMGIGMF